MEVILSLLNGFIIGGLVFLSISIPILIILIRKWVK